MRKPESTTRLDFDREPLQRRRPGGGEADGCAGLVALLAEQMVQAWRRGERPGVEVFLGRHPELTSHPTAVLDLLYEEICLRQEYHEPINRAALAKRFPAWEAHIGMLVDCIYTLESGINGGSPAVGETLGDFQLVAELGRGGQGRVFLATQSSLGGRPVVLKIAPRIGQEHLSLARLQHTHIVPLLSLIDEPERNLRVLCMPYYGGLTLAAILEGLQDLPADQRTGQQILTLLDQARAAAAVALPPSRDPASPYLSRASFVQAVTWLGACLAEALKYAHERGLVHLDLKPSNVLLTADRQPMLLDFHLAREPLKPGDLAKRLGGTPIYMSPEQKRAIAALKNKGTINEPVDGRSDIYSLGFVLYEALSGTLPKVSDRPLTPLHQLSAPVPVGLSDIIGKCLAPDAKDRYADAGELAADLWGHLNNLPLKGVGNRSVVERWQKWRRRKPHLLALFFMLAAVLGMAAVAVTSALIHAGQNISEARLALAAGQKLTSVGQYDEAADTLRHGLALLKYIPANHDLRERLLRAIALAPRAKLADELHLIADRFRSVYGMPPQRSSRLQVLDKQCRDLWENRQLALDKLGKDLDREMKQRVRLDLLELAISGSNLHVALASVGLEGAARQNALRMLDEAEALFGPSAVLYHERALHADKLGERDIALAARRLEVGASPGTAWEFYALGRSLLQEGNTEAAALRFERALALDPTGLWPNFFRGLCSYRLGRYVEASVAFTVCATLAPKSAACFYNRGLAFVALNRPDLARSDFDHALEIDPDLTEAAIERNRLGSSYQDKSKSR
jgi:eukaryotic-like serine/threonine-protein kinase